MGPFGFIVIIMVSYLDSSCSTRLESDRALELRLSQSAADHCAKYQTKFKLFLNMVNAKYQTKFASKEHKIQLKSMLHHPLSLKGVYSFIIYVNFYSKMQKKRDLRVHRQKNSTASLKIAERAL